VVATVEQLAALVRGRLVGDGSISIHSARPVGEAGPGDITFIENERYARMLRTSPASAAIVGPHFKKIPSAQEPALAMIEVDDPILAFLAVRNHLGAAEKPRWTGIHPQAWVAPSARVGADVAIYPFVYVGDEAIIEDGATLHPGVVIGDRCRVGRDTIIHPNAVLYRDVTVGDRVEIHAGTVLGGDGSCKTGDYVMLAGQAGIKDHTEIGDRVVVGAQAGVHRNVAAGQQILGSPAIPVREQRRLFQMIARLPEMHRQLRELATQVAVLSAMVPHESDHEQDPTGF
jgi:UDP-3-O-[3-hydroxymyristoyl] glucosamine N-acyltransferase